MTTRQLLLAGAWIGAAAGAASAAISLLEALGRTPVSLFLETYPWASMLRIGGVPVEFLVLAWFSAVLLLYGLVRPRPSAALLVAVSAAALAGFSAWYLVTRSAVCIPYYVFAASSLLILTGVLLDDAVWPSSLASAVRADWSAFIASAWSRAAVIAFCAVIALSASVIHVLASGLTRDEAFERDLRRWYLSQRPDLDEATASALLTKDGVRIVVFADYQAPEARHVVPQRAAQAARFRERGLRVDHVFMAMPLGRDCLADDQPSISCESAYAMKLVQAQRGARTAEDLAAWLYSRASALTPQLIGEEVARHGLGEMFRQQRDALRRATAADVRLARRLGVDRPPAYFVNGVRMPEGKGMLNRFLEIEAAQRGIAGFPFAERKVP